MRRGGRRVDDCEWRRMLKGGGYVCEMYGVQGQDVLLIFIS